MGGNKNRGGLSTVSEGQGASGVRRAGMAGAVWFLCENTARVDLPRSSPGARSAAFGEWRRYVGRCTYGNRCHAWDTHINDG
jgi:hypothetical protein